MLNKLIPAAFKRRRTVIVCLGCAKNRALFREGFPESKVRFLAHTDDLADFVKQVDELGVKKGVIKFAICSGYTIPIAIQGWIENGRFPTMKVDDPRFSGTGSDRKGRPPVAGPIAPTAAETRVTQVALPINTQPNKPNGPQASKAVANAEAKGASRAVNPSDRPAEKKSPPAVVGAERLLQMVKSFPCSCPQDSIGECALYVSNGIASEDLFVLKTLGDKGVAVAMVRVTDLVSDGSAMSSERLNFLLKGEAKTVAQCVERLVQVVIARGPSLGVVICEDGSRLMRSLVHALRLLRIHISLLVPWENRGQLDYAERRNFPKPVSCPISDFALIPPVTSISFAGFADNSCRVSVSESLLERSLAGARTALLVFPLISISSLTPADFARVNESMQAILEDIEPMTTIIVVSRSERGGGISPVVQKALMVHHRIRFLSGEDSSELMAALRLADRIFVADRLDFWCLSHLGVQAAKDCFRLIDIGEATPPAAGLSQGETVSANSYNAYFGRAKATTDVREWIALVKGVRGDDEVLAELAFVGEHKGERVWHDCIVIPDRVDPQSELTSGRQKYIPCLLGARRMIGQEAEMDAQMLADVHVQFGAEPSESKSRGENLRHLLSRRKLIVEDGFIRGIGLWTNVDEPTHSLIIDTKSAYYDATRATLLESLLAMQGEIPGLDVRRSRSLIEKIVKNKISKYNHAPEIDLPSRGRFTSRILLIDQKAGDMSLKYGMADSQTFEKMFDDAVSLPGDVQILIKQHPCAIDGGEQHAHYTRSKLAGRVDDDRVRLIGFDINPFSLINAVDEAWVVSSGMGFEALMAGKKVRCYGVPFYSGWGLTHDMQAVPRRGRNRTVEEVFWSFYILLSRYANPENGQLCELDELLDGIIKQLRQGGHGDRKKIGR